MTAVHLATPRAYRNRVYSRCGHWTSTFTTDPSQITCKTCLRLFTLDSKANTVKNTTITSILLAFSLLTGCGDAPTYETSSASSSTSSGSSGEAPTSGDSSSSSASSGDDSDSSSSGGMSGAPMDKTEAPTAGSSDSTSDDTSTSDSTGDSDDSTGGVASACWAEECSEDRPCGNNLACLPHPITGAMNCAASDCAAPGPCDKSEKACGDHVPVGECFKDVTGHGWCHPRQCKDDLTCEVGTCSAASGFCY